MTRAYRPGFAVSNAAPSWTRRGLSGVVVTTVTVFAGTELDALFPPPPPHAATVGAATAEHDDHGRAHRPPPRVGRVSGR